ncbi:potassium channel subfamily T member 1 isoform X5 [Tachysurus ichikawai]
MAGAKRTESPCDSDQEVKSELRKSASDQQQNNAATPLRTSSTMASDGGQRYRRDQQSEHSAASSYIIRSATVARAGETDPGSAWALECARILSNFSAPGNAAYSPGSALHACVEWSSV